MPAAGKLEGAAPQAKDQRSGRRTFVLGGSGRVLDHPASVVHAGRSDWRRSIKILPERSVSFDETATQ